MIPGPEVRQSLVGARTSPSSLPAVSADSNGRGLRPITPTIMSAFRTIVAPLLLVAHLQVSAAVPTEQQILKVANGELGVRQMEWGVRWGEGAEDRFIGAIQSGTFYVQMFHPNPKPVGALEGVARLDVSGQNCKHTWRLMDGLVSAADVVPGRYVNAPSDPGRVAGVNYTRIRAASTLGLQFVQPGSLEETSGTWRCRTDPLITEPHSDAQFSFELDAAGRITRITYAVAPANHERTVEVEYGPNDGFPIQITSERGMSRVTVYALELGEQDLTETCGYVPSMFVGQPVKQLTVWTNGVPHHSDQNWDLAPKPDGNTNRGKYLAAATGLAALVLAALMRSAKKGKP